jgi:hypothetical protein
MMSAGASPIRESVNPVAQPQLSAAFGLFAILGVSALLLIPCFWMPHLEAGDLSSHMYNAWLAGQVESGAAPGLKVTMAWTNTLADFALETLPGAIGWAATEKVVTGTAVLIFFWGAFSLIRAASGRRPWLLGPIVAMLSYGLIFHLGFLNFYLAMGLAMWVMVLLWRPPTPARAVAAGVLLVLALLAHAMPVAWAVSVLGYRYLARRLQGTSRVVLPLAAFAALSLLAAALSLFPHRWSLDSLVSLGGLAGLTGVEQVWLFGARYLLVAAALLVICFLLLLDRIDQGELLTDPVAQLWVLHLAAFVLLPSAILFPQYSHLLAYIPQRISLMGAIFFCMMVGGATRSRGLTRLVALPAALFFVFLYIDDRAFNSLENEIASLVQQLPPGQKVVAAITDTDTRLNAPLHMIDRACIGHCFSYGDYEPATGQFRIRIAGLNGVAAPTMKVVQDIENGEHIVTPQEAPLYSVCLNDKTGEGRFILRALQAGERTCGFSLPVSPRMSTNLIQ